MSTGFRIIYLFHQSAENPPAFLVDYHNTNPRKAAWILGFSGQGGIYRFSAQARSLPHKGKTTPPRTFPAVITRMHPRARKPQAPAAEK